MARPVLLFDVLDTLVHDPFYAEVLDFFGMSLEELFAVKSKEAWKAFERGEMSEAQLRDGYFEDGRALDLEGLRRCMQTHFRWLPGMEGLLNELRGAGYELHALSNYPIWFEIIEQKLTLSRYLSWDLVSCRTGLRKPAPATYENAARHVGRDPQACLFIDDRAKNCAGAEQIGMPALLFENAAALRNELVTRRLL